MPAGIGYPVTGTNVNPTPPARTENAAAPPERNIDSLVGEAKEVEQAEPVRRPEPSERREANLGNNIDTSV